MNSIYQCFWLEKLCGSLTPTKKNPNHKIKKLPDYRTSQNFSEHLPSSTHWFVRKRRSGDLPRLKGRRCRVDYYFEFEQGRRHWADYHCFGQGRRRRGWLEVETGQYSWRWCRQALLVRSTMTLLGFSIEIWSMTGRELVRARFYFICGWVNIKSMETGFAN